MALGWCMECVTLRTITPLAQKWGSRECDWAPIDHLEPHRHSGCGGPVHDTSDSTIDDRPIWVCEFCNENIDEDQIAYGGTRCSGSRKPIR